MPHYQVGGSTLNLLKRGPTTYYSINFDQHSNFYNFFDAQKTVVDFLKSVKNKFVDTDNAEVHGSVSLVNYQLAESDVIIKLQDQRI